MKASRLAVLALTSLAGTCAALAQEEWVTPDINPPREIRFPISFDSGLVFHPGELMDERVIASTVVQLPDAAYSRIDLTGTVLAGDPAAEGARVRLTSMADGDVQVLNAEHLGFWGNISGAFRGGTVTVELLSHGGIGGSRLVVAGAIAGEPGSVFGVRSICDGVDDRVLSNDPRDGRLSNGCTAWLFNDANRMFLTAGHCGPSTAGRYVGFNVPFSTSTGTTVPPALVDQYPVELASDQGVGGGTGNDWRYFGTNINTTTGYTAFQVQQQAHVLAATTPAPSGGAQIRITGFGTVTAPVSPTWNSVQKTHEGPYTSLSGTVVRYRADTTGGNSGSAIVHVPTGQAVGIHTHGGCGASGSGSNIGTALQNAGFTAARNAPLSICRSGAFPPSGELFVVGDAANNFGRIDPNTGRFGKVATVGRRWQGLAYDPESQQFIAMDSVSTANPGFFTIDPATGVASPFAATFNATTTLATLTCLAYDPLNKKAYAISGANGQLWSVTLCGLSDQIAPIGGAGAAGIGGLEYDHTDGQLYAVSDALAGGQLLRIDPATGVQTAVGSLLASGTLDLNGLALFPGGNLYTINAATDELLRIDRATGAATVVGPTLGLFGSQFGMAARYSLPPCNDLDFNNDNVSPDITDINDLLGMYGGGSPACPAMDSIDFNRDGVSPDVDDLVDFLRVYGGGSC